MKTLHLILLAFSLVLFTTNSFAKERVMASCYDYFGSYEIEYFVFTPNEVPSNTYQIERIVKDQGGLLFQATHQILSQEAKDITSPKDLIKAKWSITTSWGEEVTFTARMFKSRKLFEYVDVHIYEDGSDYTSDITIFNSCLFSNDQKKIQRVLDSVGAMPPSRLAK